MSLFRRRSARTPTAASKDAWYRSADWDDGARAEFDAGLARSTREYRVQYRRIKAIALLGSGDTTKETAGRDLLEQTLADRDTRGDERTTALCLLGAFEHDAGRLDEAERHLRAALVLISSNPSGSSQLEEIRLAEILLARGERQHLEEARDLLDRRASPPPRFLSNRFRMCLAGARVSLALEDRARAADWATEALDLAASTSSGLANHPTLGLVETDAGTRAWLTAVAAGQDDRSAGR